MFFESEGDFETRVALLALTGSALGWTIKLIYEGYCEMSRRQLEKWELQLEIYWPMLCYLYNIRIFIIEANHINNKGLLKSEYCIELAQNVKNSIINTIHKAAPRNDLLNALLDIETTIDAGLVYDDPFRFLSLELIDSISYFIKNRVMDLTNKIHKNTCTVNSLEAILEDYKNIYYDSNHMDINNSLKKENIELIYNYCPQTIKQRQKILFQDKNNINKHSNFKPIFKLLTNDYNNIILNSVENSNENNNESKNNIENENDIENQNADGNM